MWGGEGYSEFFQNLPWSQRGNTLVGLNTNIYSGFITTSMADLVCNHPGALSKPLVLRLQPHSPPKRNLKALSPPELQINITCQAIELRGPHSNQKQRLDVSLPSPSLVAQTVKKPPASRRWRINP